MKFLKRLFCEHDYEFVRNIYGDEIIEYGWDRSVWRCKHCGKYADFAGLHGYQPTEQVLNQALPQKKP